MIVRNWRDVGPVVSHDNAIVWHIFAREGTPWEGRPEAGYVNCLKRMTHIVKHAQQASKSGDLHSHQDQEQLYVILRGTATVRVGDEIQDVQEGDTIYLPSDIPHQISNASSQEEWLEYLVIGCPLN
jgi:mannose-6-phosphate isomerase-like protein (cupin superfamily)